MKLAKSFFSDCMARYGTVSGWITICFLSFFSAFALIGSDYYLLPVPRDPLFVDKRLDLILLSALFVPVIWALLFLFEWLFQHYDDARMRLPRSEKPRVLLIFLIFGFVWTLYLIAYNPAVFSNDSMDHWMQADGTMPLNNWHPILYTFFVAFCKLFSASPTSVAVFQILIAAILFTRILSEALRLGEPFPMTLLFAIFFAIAPVNGLHIISVWKDIPYALSLLWLSFLLFRFFVRNSPRGRSFYIELGICLAMVALFRHNGILVTAAVILFFVFYMIRHKVRRIFLAICLALSLIFLVDQLCFRLLGGKENSNGDEQLTIVMINQLLAVDHLGGEVNSEARTLIEGVMGPMENIPFSYYYADGVWRGVLPDSWKNTNDQGQLTSPYLKTVLTNWKKMPRIWLLELELLWSIDEGEDNFTNLVNYIGFPDSFYEKAGFPRAANSLRPVFDWLLKAAAASPFRFLLWHNGINNILCLIMIFMLNRHGQTRFTICFLPYFLNLISLSLITLPDYRYVYPNFLITWMMIGLVGGQINNKLKI